jgi:hypothetical protein
MSPVPQVDYDIAKPYATPQMVRMFFHMLGNTDLMYTPEEEKFLDYKTVFGMHRSYYGMYNIKFVDIYDSIVECNTPLITRGDFYNWLILRLCMYTVRP